MRKRPHRIPCLPQRGRRRSAFTLIELLAVITVMVLLTALAVPAFNSINQSGDITKAVYDLTAAVETARAFALGNSTYVWVGFFEEDGSRVSNFPTAASGTGRVVISIVASRDGTSIYNSSNLSAIDPTRLIQVGALTKINNMHLATFPDASTPGTGITFDTRPSVDANSSVPPASVRIGDTAPPVSQTPFQYPLGSAAAPQYQFLKAIQFSPRGEVRIDNNSYSISRLVEIGLQPTHGATLDVNTRNLVAIQISGFAGNIITYRK